MSSEGSVVSSGSRIRQFGLYRTIDARTEEFLRSSRKRQIRQGCACAAISTAITVTVVVSVILVYEYSINSESNSNKKILVKPNWIGLMNESDITSLGSKFNKKINFDRTTLKLLPILLKALNKNRYLEKILEDYSSSSPPYVGKDSTEATFTRNVFSDSKNWLKMPTSRLYTVDYKTSPLVYWKSPTQRLEYLTKIRKIRDYQRMLNYFDKMINEKVGSIQKKDFDYTENPMKAETVPMKKDKIKKIQELWHPLETIKNVKEFRTESNEGIVSCKCPKKLGQLLSKLISGIQDMIPHMITNKLGVPTCGNETNVTTKAPVTTSQFTTRTMVQAPKKQRINEFSRPISVGSNRKMIHKLIKKPTTLPPKLTTFFKRRISTRTSSTPRRISTSTSTRTSTRTNTRTSTGTNTRTSTRTNTRTSTGTNIRIRTRTSTRANTKTSTSTISSTAASVASTTKKYIASRTTIKTLTSTKSSFIENKSSDDSTVPLPIKTNTLMPNSQKYEKNIIDYDMIVKPTDTTYIETTKIPEKRTTMFVPMKFIEPSNEVHSYEKALDVTTVKSSHSHAIIPLYREDEYDDFVTTSKTTNSYENLDVHSVELLKTKTRLSNHNEFKTGNNFNKLAIKPNPLNYHPATKPKDFDLSPMKKITDMIYLPHEKNTKEWKYNIEPKQSVPYPESKLNSRLLPKSKITNSVESYTSLSNIKLSSSHKNSTKITSSVPDVKLEHLETKISAENVGEEEFQDEYGVKQTESSTGQPYKYKNSTKIATVTEKQSTAWELLKNEEKVTIESPKSMLPSMRPLYLEVQRNNDWKQDDHADYDINFNNNIFDLPNIN